MISTAIRFDFGTSGMDMFTAVEAFTQIITYVMIVAGIPACIRMLRTSDTKRVPYPFFLAGTVNSVMAIGYGILVGNKTVMEINVFAMFCNVFYIASYLYSSKSKGLPVSQLFGCMSFLAGTYIYITTFLDPSEEMDAIGVVMLMCSTVMLLTPLLPVKQCIKEKNTANLNSVMLVAGFLCCGAWATYGALLKDFYIYGPNILGVTAYVCQAIAMLVYRGGQQKTEHTD